MNRTAPIMFLLCVILSLYPPDIAAFEWPVERKILTATFGESRQDHFHDGIDIGGGAQPIHPIGPGEIIFMYEEGEALRDFPSGLGNFIVVQHERNVRSLYAHLQSDTLPVTKTSVASEDTVGVIGDSGKSLGKHLHLTVIDGEVDQWVNPLMLLPPITDARAPSIRRTFLHRLDNPGAEEWIEITSRITLPAGRYAVSAEVYDLSGYVDYFCPMSPFMMSLYLNGEEAYRVSYKSLQFDGEDVVLSREEGERFDFFYRDDWTVRLGEVKLGPGMYRLELYAADISENESSRSYFLDVRG